MKALHIAASLSPEWGGPPKVVCGLTKALAKKGVEVSIFAPSENDKGVGINDLKLVKVRLFPKNFLSRFWTSYSSSLAKALREEVPNFDLIHIHEIWHHPHFVAYRLARKFNKPYVITIHGALEPWCLNYKTIKKRIFSSLFERQILEQASALHAITEQEVKNIRAFGVNNTPIVTIPNGIDLQEFQNLPPKEELIKIYPQIKNQKIVLFLGRIHPIKGLDLLGKAFAIIAKKRKDVYLLIAGPDEEGYQAQIEKLLEKERVLNKVIFTGILSGYKKLVALSGADIFVLSSYSEGFSITILEAMACGLPVIITTGCNFPEVAENTAGIVINLDVDELKEALIKLLENPELAKKMGENGKNLVIENYTWDKIADKMIMAYKEILANHKVGIGG